MDVLVVSRYLPNESTSSPASAEDLSDAARRNDSLDDFNHPRYRRLKILEELKKRSGFQFIKPNEPAKDLKPYGVVQSNELIEFLSTAWDRWDALGPEGQDPSSALPVSPQPESPEIHVTLPLIPGNVPLPREPYQRPSKNVMGQIGYYCTDTCTPIFDELREELCWDVAVLEESLGRLSSHKVVYALATHPGHHAAANSFGGYCYLNHAAFAARRLQQNHNFEKVAILDIDYVRHPFASSVTVLVETHSRPNAHSSALWQWYCIDLLQRSFSVGHLHPLPSRS